MKETLSVIQQYREVLKKHRSDVIIEVDKHARQSSPFYIERLENFAARLGATSPPQRHSHHYFELVLVGTGSKTVGFSRFEVRDNMLVTVPSRMVQSGGYHGPVIRGFVLGFDLDFFLNKAFPRYLVENKGMLNSTSLPYIHLSASQASKLAGILESLLQECESPLCAPAQNEIIPIKILEFLILSDRYGEHASATGEDAQFNRIIYEFNKLIDQNFMEQRSVNFYAARLSLHQNSLNAIVKTHSGMSAKALINSRIAEEAKYLLANTVLSIKEAAGKLGFDDPNYFSYFFKRETRQSPLEFKQAVLLQTA